MTIDKAREFGAQYPSPIVFRIDSKSGVPTFKQIVFQVEHALLLGYLKTGDQLPRIRDVVSSLLINPNTVMKAYRDLEQKGLIRGRPGQGTFVVAKTATMNMTQLSELRESCASGWLVDARSAEIDDDAIVALVLSVISDNAVSTETKPDADSIDGSEVVA
jgi:GntR family transcriptional regulator